MADVQFAAAENLSVAAHDKEETHGKAAVLGYDGAEGDTADVPMENDDEQEAAEDIDTVDEYGNPHWELGVLHAYEPSFHGIEAEGGGCCPDAYEEVGKSQSDDRLAPIEYKLGQQGDRVLQDDEQNGNGQGDGESAVKDAHRLVKAARSICLCGESACAHAKETEVPVDEVENLRAYGDGADMQLAEVANNSGIDQAQQGYGDIGNDVRQSQLQDFLVHVAVMRPLFGRWQNRTFGNVDDLSG